MRGLSMNCRPSWHWVQRTARRAHADLAETYLGLNRKAEAKAEALKALEQAPTARRAQDLLLSIKRN